MHRCKWENCELFQAMTAKRDKPAVAANCKLQAKNSTTVHWYF